MSKAEQLVEAFRAVKTEHDIVRAHWEERVVAYNVELKAFEERTDRLRAEMKQAEQDIIDYARGERWDASLRKIVPVEG